MTASARPPAAPALPRLVVAGGSGWIGSAVVDAARARGRDVVALVRTPPARGDEPRRLVTWDALDDVLSEKESVVINAAGRVGGSPAELHEANVVRSAELADTCLRHGASLVSVGSAAEYGPPTTEFVAETHPEAPASDYARSKLEATTDLRARWSAGMRVTVARVFNVVGPWRASSDPLQDFAAAVSELPESGGTVHPWDSSLVRDYATLGWVADRILDLTEHAGSAPVVNVCSGRGVGFRELITAMAAERGVPVQIVDTRPGGIPRVVGDPRLLHSLTGVPPEEGVARLAHVALEGHRLRAEAERLHP